jgi:hypothetical protein
VLVERPQGLVRLEGLGAADEKIGPGIYRHGSRGASGGDFRRRLPTATKAAWGHRSENLRRSTCPGQSDRSHGPVEEATGR